MSPLKKEQLDNLRCDFLLSSTPNYLFLRLRKSAVVRELARTVDARTITERLTSLVQEPIARDGVIELYALLLALTLKQDSSAVLDALRVVPDDTSDWCAEIKALCSKVTKSTLIVQQMIPPKLQLTQPIDSPYPSTVISEKCSARLDENKSPVPASESTQVFTVSVGPVKRQEEAR